MRCLRNVFYANISFQTVYNFRALFRCLVMLWPSFPFFFVTSQLQSSSLIKNFVHLNSFGAFACAEHPTALFYALFHPEGMGHDDHVTETIVWKFSLLLRREHNFSMKNDVCVGSVMLCPKSAPINIINSTLLTAKRFLQFIFFHLACELCFALWSTANIKNEFECISVGAASAVWQWSIRYQMAIVTFFGWWENRRKFHRRKAFPPS